MQSAVDRLHQAMYKQHPAPKPIPADTQVLDLTGEMGEGEEWDGGSSGGAGWLYLFYGVGGTEFYKNSSFSNHVFFMRFDMVLIAVWKYSLCLLRFFVAGDW